MSGCCTRTRSAGSGAAAGAGAPLCLETLWFGFCPDSGSPETWTGPWCLWADTAAATNADPVRVDPGPGTWGCRWSWACACVCAHQPLECHTVGNSDVCLWRCVKTCEHPRSRPSEPLGWCRDSSLRGLLTTSGPTLAALHQWWSLPGSWHPCGESGILQPGLWWGNTGCWNSEVSLLQVLM